MKGKAKLAHIVGMVGKIVGEKQVSLSDLYLIAVEWKSNPVFSISETTTQTAKCQEKHLQKSFIPHAISILNSKGVKLVVVSHMCVLRFTYPVVAFDFKYASLFSSSIGCVTLFHSDSKI